MAYTSSVTNGILHIEVSGAPKVLYDIQCTGITRTSNSRVTYKFTVKSQLGSSQSFLHDGHGLKCTMSVNGTSSSQVTLKVDDNDPWDGTAVHTSTIEVKDVSSSSANATQYVGFTVIHSGVSGGTVGAVSITESEKKFSVTSPALLTYTITYKANEGTFSGNVIERTETKNHGSNYTISSTIPTRNGYTFSKWYTNSTGSGGTSYNPGGTYSGNAALTLYAIWSPIEYTITYNANGGTLSGSSTTKFKITDNITTAAGPSRPGYTFAGWEATSVNGNWTLGTVYTAQHTIQAGKYGNVTFKAQWVALKYTYTLLFNNPDSTNSSAQFDYYVTDKNWKIGGYSEKRTGYVFSHWRVTESVGNWTAGEIIEPQQALSDRYGYVTLSAVWTPYALTIAYDCYKSASRNHLTLNSNTFYYSNDNYYRICTSAEHQPHKTISGTENVFYQEYYYSTSSISPNNFSIFGLSTNTGYKIEGWENSTGDKVFVPGTYYRPTEYSSNLTNSPATIFLTAKVQPITYYVNFQGNGSTGPAAGMASQIMTYDVSANLAANKYVKTGHHFVNWKDTLGNTYADKALVKNLSSVDGGSVTLNAQWELDTYTITFNANGGSLGSVPRTQTKYWGTTLTLTTAKPTWADHIFLGWSTDSKATTVEYLPGASYTKNEAATLYAVWATYVKPGTISITDNGNNTFIIKATRGAAGTNNPVKGFKVDWGYDSAYTNTLINSSTATSYTSDNLSLVCPTEIPYRWVCARCETIGTYGESAVIMEQVSVKNYVAPSAPGKPYLTDSSYRNLSNKRLTVKYQPWRYNWTAAKAANDSSPVDGYRVRLYKNGQKIVGLKSSNNELIQGTGTEEWVDRSTATYGADSSNTFTIYFNPNNFGFKAGDTVQLGLYSYARNGKGNMLFNGGGTSDAQVKSDITTVQNAAVVYVKIDNSWREGIVHVKTDNNTWKEADVVYVKGDKEVNGKVVTDWYEST